MSEHRPIARLIREPDRMAAVLVWYVTADRVGAPPVEFDAFYLAAWADGMVLHRPNFASDHLYLVHVDPAEVLQTAQTLYSLFASVSPADRVSLPSGDFDSTTQVRDKAGSALIMRGETGLPNSTREQALHAAQTAVAYYLESFQGQQYRGEPQIRWIAQ